MASTSEQPSQAFVLPDPSVFEAITPGQFVSFTTTNTLKNHRQLLHFPILRVAVLDSPLAKDDNESPSIAAMLVPKNRETDWNFCTESGHLQILFNFPNVSRLILIGNMPPHKGPSVYKLRPIDPVEQKKLETDLKPLLMPLHPKVSSDHNSLPETPFLTYEDDMAFAVTVAKLSGPIVGEFLVEDVELVGGNDRNKQLRRRLRFKRMPRVVQSQALLHPIIPYDEGTTQTDLESLRKIENSKFVADPSILVHPHLTSMIAGLSFIVSNVDPRIRQGFAPRALCLGVGGGVLLSFLATNLWFEVTGVEADPIVLNAATQHFGLNESASIHLIVGDAIEFIQNLAPRKIKQESNESEVGDNVPDAKFDAVFVDLDSSDAKNGFSAPPPEFAKKPVFETLRSLLDDQGVLIINVVSPNDLFYSTLVKELKEIFYKVHYIDVGPGVQGNKVVMAILSPTFYDGNDSINEFLEKLESLIPEDVLENIVDIL
ncbi:hypothetical protein L2E82_32821 [Cichorium intybus]|uniref:Uncharacterized protein n=1 Tax=Cichorium intybus TaxID=13427 RepID=A0ACB9BIX0_CICIN|nr:hypothetical protein L2E82_32821 [Cichorium intybus]